MLPCILYNSSCSAHLTGFVMCLPALLPDPVVSTLKAESGSPTAEMFINLISNEPETKQKNGMNNYATSQRFTGERKYNHTPLLTN